MTDKARNTIKDYSIKSWIERSKNRDLFKNFNELTENPVQDQGTDLVHPEHRDSVDIDRLIAGITPNSLKKETKKRAYSLFYTESCGEHDLVDDSKTSVQREGNCNVLEDIRDDRNNSECTRNTQNAQQVSSDYNRGNKETSENKNQNHSNKKLKGLSEKISKDYESFFDDDAMSLTPSPTCFNQKSDERYPTFLIGDPQVLLADFQEETPTKNVTKKKKEKSQSFKMDENNETPNKFLAEENPEETPIKYTQLLPDETPRKFLNEKDTKSDLLLQREGSVKSTKEATSQENIPLSLSDYSSDHDDEDSHDNNSDENESENDNEYDYEYDYEDENAYEYDNDNANGNETEDENGYGYGYEYDDANDYEYEYEDGNKNENENEDENGNEYEYGYEYDDENGEEYDDENDSKKCENLKRNNEKFSF